MTLVARLFGFLEHHVIVTCGANGLALQAAQRAHIGDELPHLIVGNLAAERGHPVRPTFDDCREDVLRIAAVDPLVVSEWRSDSTAPMGVAARAVHLIEQPLPFGNGVRVVLVRISDPGFHNGWPRLQRAHDDRVRSGRRRRSLSKPALLALTPCYCCSDNEKQCGLHTQGHDVEPPETAKSTLGTP